MRLITEKKFDAGPRIWNHLCPRDGAVSFGVGVDALTLWAYENKVMSADTHLTCLTPSVLCFLGCSLQAEYVGHGEEWEKILTLA